MLTIRADTVNPEPRFVLRSGCQQCGHDGPRGRFYGWPTCGRCGEFIDATPHVVRQLRERLWSNECLDARARAMADRTGAGAR